MLSASSSLHPATALTAPSLPVAKSCMLSLGAKQHCFNCARESRRCGGGHHRGRRAHLALTSGVPSPPGLEMLQASILNTASRLDLRHAAHDSFRTRTDSSSKIALQYVHELSTTRTLHGHRAVKCNGLSCGSPDESLTSFTLPTNQKTLHLWNRTFCSSLTRCSPYGSLTPSTSRMNHTNLNMQNPSI